MNDKKKKAALLACINNLQITLKTADVQARTLISATLRGTSDAAQNTANGMHDAIALLDIVRRYVDRVHRGGCRRLRLTTSGML